MSDLSIFPPPQISALQQKEHVVVPFSHYVGLLRREAWKIAAFVIAVSAVTYWASKRVTPLYESTVVVDVNWQAPNAVVGQEALRNGAPLDAEQFLATQIRLVQSDVVLRPVAEKYGLLNEERQIPRHEAKSARDVSQAPINLVRLTIARPLNTYLLTISYRSPDPQQAADVANGIAQSYMQATYQLRMISSSNLSSFIEHQLDGLKAKMNASSRDLVDLERDMNVLNPDDKTNILSARLLQLNADYATAQAERVGKEALLHLAENDQMATSEAAGLTQLRQSLDDAQRRFAIAKTTFGPVHPEYQKVANEVTELKRQIEEKKKELLTQVHADFEQAKAREQMLNDRVTATKAEYDRMNARSFQYQERKREVDADKALYSELMAKIQEAGINSGFQSNVIRIADYARPAARPVWPSTKLNVLLAFLLSTVAGVVTVIARDAFDETVHDPDTLERHLGANVIGVLPSVKQIADKLDVKGPQPRLTSRQSGTTLFSLMEESQQPSARQEQENLSFCVYAEAIRTLRSTIVLSDFDRRLRTIMVTSAGAGEGKTTTAINLAAANAGQGGRTLIVDADLRQPTVHQRLGIDAGRGFFEVLTNALPWREAVRQIQGIPNLSVISAGQPSKRAADVIGPRVEGLFNQMKAEYDLIIIDSPGVGGFADPLQMATLADGVLVVSEAGVTSLVSINKAFSILTRVRANVIGVVLNKVRPRADRGSDRYVWRASAATARHDIRI